MSKHDHAQRRKATRKQRETGCSVYIPAELLEAVGIDPSGDTPWYRTWAGPPRKNPTILVQLYREP